MKTTSVILKILLTVLILFPAGCSSTPQGESLLGKWQLTYVYQNGNKMSFGSEGGERVLEFFEDGIIAFSDGARSHSDVKANYKIVGDTLTFDGTVGEALGAEHRIRIEGDTLLLINNVNTLEFTRLK